MSILRQNTGCATKARGFVRLMLCALVCMLATEATAAWRVEAAETLAERAGDHRLIVLGEMHGTQEVPLLAGDLVERWSEHAPVLLALEIPVSEHVALAASVAAGGDATTLDALRRRTWWQRPPQESDGRRSEDVLALIQRVGRLRQAGRNVAVLAFDPRDARCFERGNCEAAMAHVLRRAHGALPQGRLLVVTGNVHAMKRRPRNAPPLLPQMPMTAHLRDLSPVSIDIAARQGVFWACAGEDTCGPMQASQPGRGGPLDADAPFDYRLVLPSFTLIRHVGERP